MQNIGAYGVEQDKVFHGLGSHRFRGRNHTRFYKNDCLFGTVKVILKREGKGNISLQGKLFLLSKTARPILNYADVAQK